MLASSFETYRSAQYHIGDCVERDQFSLMNADYYESQTPSQVYRSRIDGNIYHLLYAQEHLSSIPICTCPYKFYQSPSPCFWLYSHQRNNFMSPTLLRLKKSTLF